jgi:radical SAM superfamily enzyme
LLSNVNRSKAYDYRIDSPKRYNRDGKSSHEGCSKCPRLENEVEKLTDLNRELRDCLDRVQERYHQPTKQRKTANDYNERHIKSIEDTYYPGRTNSTATKYQKGIADHSLEKLQ